MHPAAPPRRALSQHFRGSILLAGASAVGLSFVAADCSSVGLRLALSRVACERLSWPMATRNRTPVFNRYRESLRSHRPGPRTNIELRDFKVQKNLLAAHSDDEGSAMDARAYSIPPAWTHLVNDMNHDISQIKIKSARTAAHTC